MLLRSLQARPADSLVWCDALGCHTAAASERRVQALRRAWHHLAGASVAVRLGQPGDVVQALLALDGLVERLLLIPATAPADLVADFVQRAASHFIVADHDPALADCAFVAVPTADEPTAVSRDELAQPDPPDDEPASATQWLLCTSGTTGTPKIVGHALASLAATAQRATDRGQRHHWGLLYDPTRFAGLQVVLQALLGGSALTLPAHGMGFDEQIALFALRGVNALSATPTLWRKLLMSGRDLPLRTITLGGETADQKILQALAKRFAQARLRHVYASTEAGVGFSVTDGQEGFPAVWLDAPPAGVVLRIGASGDAADGELWLRSTRAARGYLGGDALQDDAGWLATGDRVASDGQRVRFLGRLNGAVNIGGDKVYPEAVEQVLLAHPAVFGARVRAKPSAFTGALIEALVLPGEGIVADGPLRDSLLGHCRQSLPRHAVPALLRFVTQLDVNASGKQDRRT